MITAWCLEVADSLAAVSKKIRLPDREAMAIVLIGARPGRGIDSLQQRIGLTQSGTVRLVDRLADRGLVRRTSQGRSVALTLTARGRRVAEQLADAQEQSLERSLAPLLEEQRRDLYRAVHVLLASTPRDRTVADRTCRLCSWPDCSEDCPVSESVLGA